MDDHSLPTDESRDAALRPRFKPLADQPAGPYEGPKRTTFADGNARSDEEAAEMATQQARALRLARETERLDAWERDLAARREQLEERARHLQDRAAELDRYQTELESRPGQTIPGTTAPAPSQSAAVALRRDRLDELREALDRQSTLLNRIAQRGPDETAEELDVADELDESALPNEPYEAGQPELPSAHADPGEVEQFVMPLPCGDDSVSSRETSEPPAPKDTGPSTPTDSKSRRSTRSLFKSEGAIDEEHLSDEQRRRLRMMRRMTGGRVSDQELLERLAAEEAEQPPTKQKSKRRWWGRS